MQAPINKTPQRTYCPPQPPSLFGWLARLLGLAAPVYRGSGQPTGSTLGQSLGPSPCYRPPRPKAPAPNGGDPTNQEQAPIERHGDNGDGCLTQPVLLEGPVTIVIGSHE
jgi:hypothetical protein